MRGATIRLGVMLIVFLVLAGYSLATPIFSKHKVVKKATHSATFDSIATRDSLEKYSEDGINIITNTFAYEGVDNVFKYGITSYDLYYGYWNKYSWVTISMEDGSRINGLDFLIGDGFGYVSNKSKNTTYLIWETFTDGTSSGFGSEKLKRGSVIGWLDDEGFDSIRVAASYSELAGFGDGPQAIAIDNVRINSTNQSVPEPITLVLLGTGCIYLIGSRAKKRY